MKEFRIRELAGTRAASDTPHPRLSEVEYVTRLINHNPVHTSLI